MAGCLLFSRKGMALSTKRTLPIKSTSKPFFQLSSSAPIAKALTLATTISMPPKSAADLATHALRLSALPTSATEPITLLPEADMALAASATSVALRAQKATFAPSLANVSAMARPMPLVPPVTSARKPLSCMSIYVSLNGWKVFSGYWIRRCIR